MAVRREPLDRNLTPIVSFRDVSYRIGAKLILDRVSFDLFAKETLVLLGKSGSGKTTALKLVNALLMPSSGQVLVDEKPTTQWDLTRLRRRIGYVIQDGGLFPHFTVEQNVGLVPRLEKWAPDKIAARTRDLLAEVGLPPDEYLRRRPAQLSGGQKQRVGVARALAAGQSLLLLDEPFSALDPETRAELQDQFLGLRERLGIAAMFVTHDLKEGERMGTRTVHLEQGRMVENRSQ